MSLPVIRAGRVLLRPWQRDDVDDLHALWILPDVRRFLWDDKIVTRETAEQAVASHLETTDRLNVGFWSVLVGPVPIAGFCGFRTTGDGPELEVLYGLRREHWGKGLATEACAAALDYLWRATSYQRVCARADVDNDRSIRVMERLGMVHESTTDSLITYVGRRPAPQGSEVITKTA